MSWILVIIAIGIGLYIKFGNIDRVTKRNFLKLGTGLVIVLILLILLLLTFSQKP
jgi:hypothetical protein